MNGAQQTRPVREIRRTGPQVRFRYRDLRGREYIVGPAEAREVVFEDCAPIRVIPHYRGSHHTPGEYWSETGGRLIAYESFLECQWMMLLDFAPTVVAFGGQPFEVSAVDSHGSWRHTPDIFARRVDGSAVVWDVKNPRHLRRPEVIQQAERTRVVCDLVGWDYRLVGQPDAQRLANVSWLHGYRRPLHAGVELVPRLLALAQQPVSIAELLSYLSNPVLARPVLFHLLWHGQLVCDLHAPLREVTLVRTRTAGSP